MTEILATIAKLSFRFAKTMPEHPHEYVKRTADNAPLYDPLSHAIRQSPIKGTYGAYTTGIFIPATGGSIGSPRAF